MTGVLPASRRTGWLLVLLLAASCGQDPIEVRVAVSPAEAVAVPRERVAFQADVRGSFSDRVVWELVSGPGSIEGDGVYVAPDFLPSAEEREAIVRARSLANGSEYADARVRLERPPFSVNHGFQAAHTDVDIYGIDLTPPGSEVRVDGQLAVLEPVSSSLSTVRVPPGAQRGAVDVIVKSGSGPERVLPASWHYGGAVEIESVQAGPTCYFASRTGLLDADGDGDLDALTACFDGLAVNAIEGGNLSRSETIPLPDASLPRWVLTDRVRSAILLGTDAVRAVRFEGSDAVFGATHTLAYPGSVTCGGAADLDADEDLDLLYCAPGSLLCSRLGDAAGGFSPESCVALPGQGFGVRAVDLDADGALDVVVQSGAGVSLLLGDGDGGLAVTTSVFGGPVTMGLGIGDFDGDGFPDVLANSVPYLNNTQYFDLHYGDGAGGIRETLPLAPPLESLFLLGAGDLDDDGTLDVAVSGIFDTGVLNGQFSGSTYSGTRTGFLPGDLSGGFGALVSIRNLSWNGELVDVDGVGRPDLLGGSAPETIGVLRDAGARRILSFSGAGDYYLADARADGDLVLVRDLESQPPAILRVDPAGIVAPRVFAGPPGLSYFSAPFVLDSNSDGVDDLLVVGPPSFGGPNELWGYLGDGVGGLAAPAIFFATTAGTISGLLTADLDGDGWEDLSFSMSSGVTGGLHVSWGSPTGLPQPALLEGDLPTGARALADLDGDGRKELVIANAVGGLAQLFFDGRTVREVRTAETEVAAQIVVAADLDRDGDDDIVIAGELGFFSAEVDVLLSNGETLQTIERLPFGTDVFRAWLTDLDGDELIDLVLHTNGSPVVILRGDGYAGFDNPEPATAEVASYYSRFIDIDDDGRLDLVFPDSTGVLLIERNGF